MEPEEADPSRLVGCFVVEAGRRQAWPFLTLASPNTGREVRLFIDANFSVEPDWNDLGQHDDEALIALDSLQGMVITRASSSATGLRLDTSEGALMVQAAGNALTIDVPWWFGNPLVDGHR